MVFTLRHGGRVGAQLQKKFFVMCTNMANVCLKVTLVKTIYSVVVPKKIKGSVFEHCKKSI